MGSPLVKELMPGPSGSPLIDFALEQAFDRDWPVHVITREEKRPLIEHLQAWQKKGCKISWQFVGVTKEWPETLLQSEAFWQESNLVVLPDTIFEPKNIWDEMQTRLDENTSACYAVLESQDYAKAKTWGVIDQGPFRLCEKPQENFASPYLAWGLMMFRRKMGKTLLQAHLESTFDHQWKSFPAEKIQIVKLSKFKDLTRG